MKWGIAIIIIVAFFSLVIISYSVMKTEAKDNWNDGICVECGGEYRLVNTFWSQVYGTMYTYECENCHHAFDSCDILK